MLLSTESVEWVLMDSGCQGHQQSSGMAISLFFHGPCVEGSSDEKTVSPMTQ